MILESRGRPREQRVNYLSELLDKYSNDPNYYVSFTADVGLLTHNKTGPTIKNYMSLELINSIKQELGVPYISDFNLVDGDYNYGGNKFKDGLTPATYQKWYETVAAYKRGLGKHSYKPKPSHSGLKLGVNPRSTHTSTPNGIYAYPIMKFKELYPSRFKQGSYHYAGEKPIAWVFRAKNPERVISDISSLEYYNEDNFKKDSDIIEEIFGSLLGYTYKHSINPGKNLWYLTKHIAEQLRGCIQYKWPLVLNALGYEGITDTSGVIYSSEPTQSVFFLKRYIEVVDVIDNNTIRQRGSGYVNGREIYPEIHKLVELIFDPIEIGLPERFNSNLEYLIRTMSNKLSYFWSSFFNTLIKYDVKTLKLKESTIEAFKSFAPDPHLFLISSYLSIPVSDKPYDTLLGSMNYHDNDRFFRGINKLFDLGITVDIPSKTWSDYFLYLISEDLLNSAESVSKFYETIYNDKKFFHSLLMLDSSELESVLLGTPDILNHPKISIPLLQSVSDINTMIMLNDHYKFHELENYKEILSMYETFSFKYGDFKDYYNLIKHSKYDKLSKIKEKFNKTTSPIWSDLGIMYEVFKEFDLTKEQCINIIYNEALEALPDYISDKLLPQLIEVIGVKDFASKYFNQVSSNLSDEMLVTIPLEVYEIFIQKYGETSKIKTILKLLVNSLELEQSHYLLDIVYKRFGYVPKDVYTSNPNSISYVNSKLKSGEYDISNFTINPYIDKSTIFKNIDKVLSQNSINNIISTGIDSTKLMLHIINNTTKEKFSEIINSLWTLPKLDENVFSALNDKEDITTQQIFKFIQHFQSIPLTVKKKLVKIDKNEYIKLLKNHVYNFGFVNSEKYSEEELETLIHSYEFPQYLEKIKYIVYPKSKLGKTILKNRYNTFVYLENITKNLKHILSNPDIIYLNTYISSYIDSMAIITVDEYIIIELIKNVSKFLSVEILEQILHKMSDRVFSTTDLRFLVLLGKPKINFTLKKTIKELFSNKSSLPYFVVLLITELRDLPYFDELVAYNVHEFTLHDIKSDPKFGENTTPYTYKVIKQMDSNDWVDIKI